MSQPERSSKPDIEVPILIVGGGPAGLTASILLSQLGVESLLVERHAGTSLTPRAHIINQRSMEIFREIGIEDIILERSTPVEQMGLVVWATTLAGRELGRWMAWGYGEERIASYQAHSPCRVVNFPLNYLEPVLKERALAAELADVRYFHEMKTFMQDATRVSAIVVDRKTQRELHVRARYMIATDGGKSPTQRALEIPMQGEWDLVTVASVHFTADLTPWVKDRPGLLYWLVNPQNPIGKAVVGSGVFVAVAPSEWIFACSYGADGEPALFDEATMTKRIRDAIGVSAIEIDIHSISHWTMHGIVADRYREGRIFLAGDAVHRFPQAGGLGMNTAVQDVHNLTWKLRTVLQNEASEALLESYERERRPIGVQNTARALENARLLGMIPEALGLFPGQPLEDGIAAIEEFYQPTEAGARKRAKLAVAIAAQDVQFNAQNVEIGFVYQDGALLPDGVSEPSLEDPIRDYHPTTRPGARLPHVWLEQNGQRVSTLDLVGRGHFTLLTSPDGGAWRTAAKNVASEVSIPLRVLTIGPDGDALDVEGHWEARREVDAEGAILVRPDGHIGWRRKGAAADPQAELRAVLQQLLHKQVPVFEESAS